MFGLAVIEVMTMSGQLSNIDEIDKVDIGILRRPQKYDEICQLTKRLLKIIHWAVLKSLLCSRGDSLGCMLSTGTREIKDSFH